MLYLGTQYWRPPTPFRSHWEEDLRGMAEAGFNTIKTWHFWSWHESEPGDFDFTDSDELFELAGRYGLCVVPNFITCSAPEWAFERYPEARFVSADGYVVPSMSIGNVNVGGFPGLCLDNDDAAEACLRFVRVFADRYRGVGHLAAWDAWNEPHVEGVRDAGWWPFFERGIYCYCEASCEAFRRWLAERYNGLEGLGERWARKYSSWSQVRPPSKRGNLVEWLDWRLFWLTNLGAHVGLVRDAVREGDPATPVMTHCGGNGSPQMEIGLYGADDWKISAGMDLHGVSIWGTGDYAQVCMALDSCRCSLPGSGPWVSECYFGPKGTGVEAPPEDPPEEAFTSAICYAAKGAKAILHWQYRSEMVGIESPNFGLLRPDGTPRPVHEALARAYRLLSEHEELLNASEAPAAQAAVLFSPHSYLLYWNVEKGSARSIEATRGAYHAMYRHVDAIDVLHPDALGDLSVYKVIYAPAVYLPTAEVSAKLAGFVQDGGCLIAEACTATRDDAARHQEELPGDGLSPVFGCRRDHVLGRPTTMAVEYGGGTFRLGSPEMMEMYRLSTGQAIGSHEAHPGVAAVANRYGEGTAILLGGWPSADGASSGELSRFCAEVLAAQGVTRLVTCSNPHVLILPRPLRPGGLLVFLVNLSYDTQVATLSVAGGPSGGRLLVSGKPVAGPELRVELPPRGAEILHAC